MPCRGEVDSEWWTLPLEMQLCIRANFQARQACWCANVLQEVLLGMLVHQCTAAMTPFAHQYASEEHD